MQCKEIENLMMKYLDGNISEIEMEQLLRHKEKCSACAMEFELLSEAIYMLEEMPDIEAPAGFEARVMEAIKNTKPQPISVQVMLLWILGLAGLSVFMVNILSLFIIPLIKNSGILYIIYNTTIYASSVAANLIKEFFLMLSLWLSKIAVSGDTLIKQYIVFAAASIALLLAFNIRISKRVRVHQK